MQIDCIVGQRVCYPSVATANTPQHGWVSLHWAAYKGHVHIVALLLATPGVDPLAREGLVRPTTGGSGTGCLTLCLASP